VMKPKKKDLMAKIKLGRRRVFGSGKEQLGAIVINSRGSIAEAPAPRKSQKSRAEKKNGKGFP